MNSTLIANWNQVVGPEDIVFHLGDFCFGAAPLWHLLLDRLNGKIYLLEGNHDCKALNESLIARFEQVSMQQLIEVGGQKIYLNHYPLLCFAGSEGKIWQLFGHVHTNPNTQGLDSERLTHLFPCQCHQYPPPKGEGLPLLMY